MEFRDFWAYFEPIRENMPKNCSADVEAAITYIDQVFTNGSATDRMTVRNAFAFDGIQHYDDMAAACEFWTDTLRWHSLSRLSIHSDEQLVRLARSSA